MEVCGGEGRRAPVFVEGQGWWARDVFRTLDNDSPGAS